MTKGTLKFLGMATVCGASIAYGISKHFEVKTLQKELEETREDWRRELWAACDGRALIEVLKKNVQIIDMAIENGDDYVRNLYLNSTLQLIRSEKLE